MNSLYIGIKGYKEIIVTENMSAKSVKSGEVEVFSTPSLIAFIEEVAWKSVAQYLLPGKCTVGSKIEIRHISPTPLGMKVNFETELIKIEEQKLVFRAEVYDESGKIAQGLHERYIVEKERFVQGANKKLLHD